MSESSPPFRVLPLVDDRNRPFWTGGDRGELCLQHCVDCGRIVHPPAPRCPEDFGTRLEWRALSGRARVATYTINHQPWLPGPPLPWVIAIVELEEDPRVRLTTQLVDCPPERVEIGLPVRVCFEAHPGAEGDEGDGVWLPLFAPDPDRTAD